MESMIITVIDKNKPIDDWIFEKKKDILSSGNAPHAISVPSVLLNNLKLTAHLKRIICKKMTKDTASYYNLLPMYQL